jgi:ABC-2 type transport system ATP-binding protein
MIQIEQISKSYNGHAALKHASFKVDRGELFGLIGPDGAGKTTLIRILMTLLLPDSGKAQIGQWDVVKDYRKIRQHVGYMPGNFSLYRDLTVEENLRFFASVFGTNIKTHYHLIKPIYEQIEPFKNRRAEKLSGGMKQKLALSCSLIHRPELLLLDEPTTGVDAVSRQEFWQMLKTMKDHGITVLVSTPYMEEADLCDRVALIQNGEILEVASPKNIVDHFSSHLYRIKGKERLGLINALRSLSLFTKVYPFGEYIHCTSDQALDSGVISEKLRHLGMEEIAFEAAVPGIEDRFIELMA